MNFAGLSSSALLGYHADIGDELSKRGITRSANNPAGDYAEYLFCKAFEWEQAAHSEKSFDAIDPASNKRYQIKSRRIYARNTSRQLSALRGLDTDCFDYLAGILFTRNFGILRAAIIPHHLVLKNSTYGEHTNSWRFFLRDGLWDEPGVDDVTQQLQEVTT
ncbi:hypothetical protein ACXYL9_06370 [Qipengyuania sp. CAU 1752]